MVSQTLPFKTLIVKFLRSDLYLPSLYYRMTAFPMPIRIRNIFSFFKIQIKFDLKIGCYEQNRHIHKKRAWHFRPSLLLLYIKEEFGKKGELGKNVHIQISLQMMPQSMYLLWSSSLKTKNVEMKAPKKSDTHN